MKNFKEEFLRHINEEFLFSCTLQGLEVGSTSGDYERELEAPLCQCWPPDGLAFILPNPQ